MDGSLGVAVMDGKIWGYGAGFARPIPPISFLFRRFPENPSFITWGCCIINTQCKPFFNYREEEPMFTPMIVKAQPRTGFRIHLEFSDGANGEIDLSHLAGKGVFVFWNNYENFKKISIVDGRWLAWSDDIDIDADSLYIKLTKKSPEDVFPLLKEDIAYA